MKSACVLALGLDAAAALRVGPGAIRMQEAATAEVAAPSPPPLPKIKTIMVGDKTLAGDMNFDPMQLADSSDKLAWFREAEVRHARLAMLAALGWPVSEMTNFGNLLTPEGRAPSVLNGGLGEVSSIYWAGVVAFAVLCEAKGLDVQFGKKDNYLPGMLGFDPLGMDSPTTRNAEITNGRVAMVAITIYAYEEALMRAPIFPINLFSPFKQVAKVVAPAVVPAVEEVAEVAPTVVVPEAMAPVLEATQTPAETLAAAAAPVAAMAEMAESVVAPIADAVAPIADAAVSAVAPIADVVAPIASAVAQ